MISWLITAEDDTLDVGDIDECLIVRLGDAVFGFVMYDCYFWVV